MLVGRLVCQSVPFLFFWRFTAFWAYGSCPDALVTFSSAVLAHSYTTRVAVYLALFSVEIDDPVLFSKGEKRKDISIGSTRHTFKLKASGPILKKTYLPTDQRTDTPSWTAKIIPTAFFRLWTHVLLPLPTSPWLRPLWNGTSLDILATMGQRSSRPVI